MLKIEFFICLCFPLESFTSQYFITTPERIHSPKTWRQFNYTGYYRDHVFTALSEKGREMFLAGAKHPLCKAKKGVCIKRAHCIEKKMLYISRTCYTRDLVCCYDDHVSEIFFPIAV